MTTIQVTQAPVNFTLPAPVEIAFTPSGGQGPAGDSLVPDPTGQPDGQLLTVEDGSLTYASPAYDDMASLTLIYENELI